MIEPGTSQAGLPIQIEDSSGNVIDPAREGFNIRTYDYVGVTYPLATTEVYTFKTGGSGGTTVATLTLVYTDSTKANLSSVTKS